MVAFLHPKAVERARCPRVDGHYVPARCLKVYLALRAVGGWVSYHERKLRELREINREYFDDGTVLWDLVETRKSMSGPQSEFRINLLPRLTAGPPILFVGPRGTFAAGVECDVLSLIESL